MKNTLTDFSLAELQAFHTSITEDAVHCLSLHGSLHARNTLGGTAPTQVQAQIERHRVRLAS